MTEWSDMGTVERKPYVGDSDIIVVACKHGDYDRVFKGGSEHAGEKALAAHYAAKHQEEGS